ncbi:MAG: HNH endonuclease, partial [Microthrixaceae bacterium]
QSPWAELDEGTRLWWVDQESREIRWEVRAARVLKQRFSSRREAGEMLRRCYGALPTDLSDYYGQAAGEGWLLAFGVDVMQSVSGVSLPVGQTLGRNGFRRITEPTAQLLQEAGLPEPAGEPTARAPEWFNPDAITDVLVPNRTRQIPASIRRAVLERDGEQCVRCGKCPPDVELHVDHIFPWSKGGPNEAWNLRVLCQTCNLSKGARVEDGAAVPVVGEPVAALAQMLQRPPIRTVEELPELVALGLADGHDEVTVRAVLAVDADERIPDRIVDRCIDELARCGRLDDRVTLLRCDPEDESSAGAVRALLNSGDRSVAQEAALVLTGFDGTDDEIPDLLTVAAESRDPLVAGSARIALAIHRDGDDLEDVLRSELQSPDAGIRATAAWELADITDDDEELLELLNVALASPDEDTFAVAAVTLANIYQETDAKRARAYLTNIAACRNQGLSEMGEKLLESFDRTGQVNLDDSEPEADPA